MNRRMFMGATAGITALGSMVSYLADWRAELQSSKAAGPSVLDQLRIDPPLIMRLAGMEPDQFQAEVLRSWDRWGVDLMLLCGRQTGKSQVVSGLALLVALLEPGSLVVVVSRSQDQSNELFRKVMSLYNRLKRPVAKANDMHSQLHLVNDSRIIPFPCTAEGILGYTAKLLVLDEGAVMPDLLYQSARPLLATTGGRLVALSTPFGKRGWFYREWEGIDENGEKLPDDGSWQRIGPVPASGCARIRPEFLAKEHNRLGPRWFRQWYECSFEDAEDATFLQEHIDRAFGADVDPLWLPGDAPLDGGAGWSTEVEELKV